MLSVEKVTEESPDLNQIQQLYLASFPENERRPFLDMVKDQSGVLEVFAFYDQAIFCGFACLLSSPEVSHILYVAIDEALRKKGYGSQVLSAIHQLKKNHKVIVDIEKEDEHASNNMQRRKRKEFYAKNGYHETDIQYRWRDDNFEIMVYGGEFEPQDFMDFWDSFDEQIARNY